MLIELIVTCVLSDGQVFTPPQGWQVSEVRAYDSSVLCDGGNCFAVHQQDRALPTAVALRRQAREGETITVPAGCKDMTATPKG